MTKCKENSFYKTIAETSALCIVFVCAALSVLLFTPKQEVAEATSVATELALIEKEVPQIPVENIDLVEENVAHAENVSWLAGKDSFDTIDTIRIDNRRKKGASSDKGLELYRNPSTRAAVEWFYTRVTGNRDVSKAIIEAANREDVPLSLAFALCYTESRYNSRATNTKNKNGSIDRGLFQLNNNSFPYLSEEEFYDAEISAKHGMQHLRYCLDVAGNDTMALAMYNAGINRVNDDKTPTSTLRYVGFIATYRANLESAFAEEVLSRYANEDRIVPVGKNALNAGF